MSNATSIGWTHMPGYKGMTWNPTTGCDRVSPGCDLCYALTMARRLKAMNNADYQTDGRERTSGPGFGFAMHEHRLHDPFKWAKPSAVFVNSMSDLFHPGATREFLAKVFAAMALTPRHRYLILTKRHTPMRSLLSDFAFRVEVADAAEAMIKDPALPISKADRRHEIDSGAARSFEWPVPNVWLGVSVENQTWADNRLSELAITPAAVRFVSCEPMIGPVDPSPWMPPIVPVWPDDAPPVWGSWNWDTWVPQDVRAAVEDFWPTVRGGPRAWLRDALDQGSHAYGQAVSAYEGVAPVEGGTGKWVHASGNLGRLIHPDGTHTFTSFSPEDVRRQRHVHWVIAGGESGRGDIRALHPEWVRGLHRQTEAAGAAFYMKQLGTLLAKEWGATGKGEDPSEWQVAWPQNYPETPVHEPPVPIGANA